MMASLLWLQPQFPVHAGPATESARSRKPPMTMAAAIHFLTSSQVSFRLSHPTWTITVNLRYDVMEETPAITATLIMHAVQIHYRSATYFLPPTLIHSAASSFLSSTVRLRLSPVDPFTAERGMN